MTEDEELQKLRETLRSYLQRVPPRVNAGSYDLSVAFKAAVQEGNKIIAKRGAKLSEMRAAIGRIQGYWA